MMKEILLLGIGFFAFMTVYNLIVAIRRKEGFTPTIMAFLMTVATLFIFFEQVLYGILCFVAMVIVAVVKHSEGSKIREGRISKELEKIDSKEPIKLRDFLTWKSWAITIVKHGAKKAAMFYALFVAICITLIWGLLRIFFPEDMQPQPSWLICFIVTFCALFYYDFSKVFERALKEVNKK
ncbi:MAG: hypothetical protein KAT65_27165 [Methanophagales archaeon]|nr:hypothetical protein [Methanophagales archaeon]